MGDNKPTGLAILVDEKRVNDLLAQTSGFKAVVRSCCNLCLFMCFLILFTVLALLEHQPDFRAFKGTILRRFDTEAAMPLSEVRSVTTFWEYFDNSFMPGIYGNDTRRYFFPDYQPDRLLPMDGGNRLFGVGRIRTLKVLPSQGCRVETQLAGYFPTCYGPFMPEAIDDASFGPPDERTGEDVFNYFSLAGQGVAGQLASYPPGGFMEAITSDYNKTVTTANLLKRGEWLSSGTRAIFIDWSIYNFNLMYQAVCRITFEVDNSGRWMPTFDVQVLMSRHLNPIASRTTEDFVIVVCEVILLLFVLFYVMEEASEFIGFRKRWPYIKWDYFSDAWNILDWLNLILIVVALGIRIDTWGKASGLAVYVGDPSKQSLDTFMDVGPVADNIRQVHRVIAFNAVLSWFKAVKYIAILPYITTFMQTVSMSQRQLFSFVAVFSSLLYGFVLAYHVAFGEQLSEFRTVWQSFVFLVGSLLGNSDMSLVYMHAPQIGSALIMLFVLAIFFVSVNLFYSIMTSALADLKKDERKQAQKWEQQVGRAKDFWNHMSESLRLEYRFRTLFPGLYTRCKRRKKRQAEKEEARDEECMAREKLRKVAEKIDLGPGDPSIGRRLKPASNKLDEQDIDSDSEAGSDVDLGPLRDKAQLQKGGAYAEFLEDKKELEIADNDSNDFVLGDEEGEDGELDAQAIELCIKATKHVVDSLVERTYGARGVLVNEMGESKDVLTQVGAVLEVLQTRTNDLELSQLQLLKQF